MQCNYYDSPVFLDLLKSRAKFLITTLSRRKMLDAFSFLVLARSLVKRGGGALEVRYMGII